MLGRRSQVFLFFSSRPLLLLLLFCVYVCVELSAFGRFDQCPIFTQVCCCLGAPGFSLGKKGRCVGTAVNIVAVSIGRERPAGRLFVYVHRDKGARVLCIVK